MTEPKQPAEPAHWAGGVTSAEAIEGAKRMAAVVATAGQTMSSREGGTDMREDYDVRVYSAGLCYASVCTRLSDAETIERANQQEPTGIPPGWSISSDPTFIGGASNPCPCDHHPETHRHVLLEA